jgi:hypothetical protein
MLPRRGKLSSEALIDTGSRFSVVRETNHPWGCAFSSDLARVGNMGIIVWGIEGLLSKGCSDFTVCYCVFLLVIYI